MIDEDAFRFGTTTDTGSIEWFFTLSFSEIMELRYKATGGRVSGILQDGAEFVFRIDQGLASEEAMRVVAALFGSETDSSDQPIDDTTSDDAGRLEELQSLEEAYADAAECGGEPQVRRFVRLVVAAGLEVERFENRRQLVAMWPGTIRHVSEIHWFPKSRFRLFAGRTGAFGADEDEPLGALPQAKVVRKMDVVEADRFLDALQTLLLSHDLERTPDNTRLIEDLEAPIPPRRSDIHRSVPRVSILSDGELAAALRSLEAAFDDAAECGVEPQARRFAELTAAADLKVEWKKEGWGHQLYATWRNDPVFSLTWNSEGRAVGMLESYAWEDTFGDTNFAQATYAFDLDRDSEADALPRLQDKSSEMDAAKFNAYTDLFLDWLEVFLATHSLPSRGADAIWQTEDRLSSRGCRAATLAVLTPLWFLLALFLLFLLPGEFPFREPVGLVIWGLLFLVVPVLAVAMGLKVKRDLREDHSTRSRNSRSAIRSAWVAIILGTLIIVGVVAGFGIAVMNRLTGDL
jgi:hypothetical protein